MIKVSLSTSGVVLLGQHWYTTDAWRGGLTLQTASCSWLCRQRAHQQGPHGSPGPGESCNTNTGRAHDSQPTLSTWTQKESHYKEPVIVKPLTSESPVTSASCSCAPVREAWGIPPGRGAAACCHPAPSHTASDVRRVSVSWALTFILTAPGQKAKAVQLWLKARQSLLHCIQFRLQFNYDDYYERVYLFVQILE